MTYPCTAFRSLEQGPVIIRRFRSISLAQAEVVAQAVATLPTPWRVESHDDYEGYLSIIVLLDGEDAPTFAITGKSDQIELCEIHDDVLHARGCFSTMGDTADALIALLGRVRL